MYKITKLSCYVIDEKRIFKEKIKCTACDKNIKEKILSNLKVFIHPALEVIVCNVSVLFCTLTKYYTNLIINIY